MAILLKCNSIFLHVPKTAGNWVADILEKNDLVFSHFGGKHSNMEQINTFEKWFNLPEQYYRPKQPFTKFCFVRNPFGWYESFFKMQRKLNWPKWGVDPAVWHPNAALDGLGSQDFNMFVSNVLKRCPGYVSNLYGWYLLPRIDFVGRQENLAEDMETILEGLGVSFDRDVLWKTAPVNKSDDADIHWEPDIREEVAYTEFSVFKQFGYEYLLPWNSGKEMISAYSVDRREYGIYGEGETYIPKSYTYNASKIETLQAPFIHEAGYAWKISLPKYESIADDEELGKAHRSKMIMFEDGQPLWQRHIYHEEIRRLGEGRYSHWKSNLFFSTTDNSDPNTNGRIYQIVFLEKEE
ncbi:MAG: sulfotransferase family 2 domain-containing protein [Anaerolineales bacterium]|nr:sulfotransferase family 2 domain-containing protein [Anaerolineales bacterium]